MIDTRTNEFATAETIEELEKKIPEDARGPMFVKGERLTIKGWIWEVQHLVEKGMFLKPIGPLENRQARRQRARAGVSAS